MAVFLKDEGDHIHAPISKERVVPSLRRTIPGLFGKDISVNSVRAAMFGSETTTYFPRRTMSPLTYVGITAETGQAMDHIAVTGRTKFHRGLDWQTDVAASLHGVPGFEAWWEGAGMDPNSTTTSFRWDKQMPTLMIDTRQKIVFPGPEVKGHPIGMIEFVKRRGKGKQWLNEIFSGHPVALEDFDINLQHNVLSATLMPREADRQPFYLRLPLVLDVRFDRGVPRRMMWQS